MAEKSNHLRQLERIYQRIYSDPLTIDLMHQYAFSPSDDILHRLEYLYSLSLIFNLIQDIKSSIEKYNQQIDIEFDNDVDFDKWSTPSFWQINTYPEDVDERVIRLNHARQWHSATDSLNSNDANSITGYLPTLPANNDFDESQGRQSLREAIALISGPFLNVCYLRSGIDNALLDLCNYLQQLRECLTRKRTPEEYANFAHSKYIAYSTKNSIVVSKEYETRKNHRDELTIDWLNGRVADAMVELYHSEFMQQILSDITDEESASSQIIFPLKDISSGDQRRFYKALSSICVFEDGMLNFEKRENGIGRKICQYKDIFKNNEFNAFFLFHLKITLINRDIEIVLKSSPHTKTKTIKKPKPSPQLNRSFMTFKPKGINSGHITLLYQKLMDINWIPKDTDSNDFLKLFSGKTCVCKIMWLGGGKGNLGELFRQIKAQDLITIPGGHGLDTILENHFTDECGNYLTGINSGKVAKKALPDIYKCIEVLQTNIDRDEDDYSY